MVLTVCSDTSPFWCLSVDTSADKLTAKAQKITIKLPWEITTIYSELLRQSGHQSDEEEDEDDIEAHEASIQRLKVECTSIPMIHDLVMTILMMQEADDATRQMTREEYQRYSDCRQASFTFRKGPRHPL
jgi:transcription initiation protein SPT3